MLQILLIIAAILLFVWLIWLTIKVLKKNDDKKIDDLDDYDDEMDFSYLATATDNISSIMKSINNESKIPDSDKTTIGIAYKDAVNGTLTKIAYDNFITTVESSLDKNNENTDLLNKLTAIRSNQAAFDSTLKETLKGLTPDEELKYEIDDMDLNNIEDFVIDIRNSLLTDEEYITYIIEIDAALSDKSIISNIIDKAESNNVNASVIANAREALKTDVDTVIDCFISETTKQKFEIINDTVNNWKNSSSNNISELKTVYDTVIERTPVNLQDKIKNAYAKCEAANFISATDIMTFKLGLYNDYSENIMSRLISDFSTYDEARRKSLQTLKNMLYNIKALKTGKNQKNKHSIFTKQDNTTLNNDITYQKLFNEYNNILLDGVVTQDEYVKFKEIATNASESTSSIYVMVQDAYNRATEAQTTAAAVSTNLTQLDNRVNSVSDEFNTIKIDKNLSPMDNIKKVMAVEFATGDYVNKQLNDFANNRLTPLERATGIDYKLEDGVTKYDTTVNDIITNKFTEYQNTTNAQIETLFENKYQIVLDALYPIGCIIIRYDHNNPQNDIKNMFNIDTKWEQISEGYLNNAYSKDPGASLAGNSVNAAGAITTSDTSLSIDQMPKHTHYPDGRATDFSFLGAYGTYSANSQNLLDYVVQNRGATKAHVFYGYDPDDIQEAINYAKTLPTSTVAPYKNYMQDADNVYTHAQQGKSISLPNPEDAKMSYEGSGKTHSHTLTPPTVYVSAWRRTA